MAKRGEIEIRMSDGRVYVGNIVQLSIEIMERSGESFWTNTGFHYVPGPKVTTITTEVLDFRELDGLESSRRYDQKVEQLKPAKAKPVRTKRAITFDD